jgi:hypothetical protein
MRSLEAASVLPNLRRWKRYQKPLLGQRVQLDVKFIAPLPGSRRKHDQFTAIHDCTRLRVLPVYPQLNQKTAIQFIDYVLERLPFRVEVIQTEPRSSTSRWTGCDRRHQGLQRQARRVGELLQLSSAPTEPWAARRPMKDSSSEPRPRCTSHRQSHNCAKLDGYAA